MLSFFASAALLVCPTAASPQGGGFGQQLPQPAKAAFAYPEDLSLAAFAPFVLNQQPDRTAVRAAGLADFDADGNLEAWFLGGGTHAGEISVQLAKTSDLGRYQDYARLPAGGWVDAATYHTTTSLDTYALFVDPAKPNLYALYDNLPFSGDPRIGGFWQLAPTLWTPGTNTFEIETADHSGDGHDDIVYLRKLPGGGYEITKFVIGTEQGYLGIEGIVSIKIPLPVDTLRVLDLDGNGSTDVIVHVPGLGLGAFFDSGNGSFDFHGGLSFTSGLRDVCTGDSDGDGREDFVLVFDQGLVVCKSLTTGLFPVVLMNPAGIGSLASAHIVDACDSNAPDLVAFPRDGKQFVVHPYDEVMAAYLSARIIAPSTALTGSGVLGKNSLQGDLDGDGDDDVIFQLPSGDTWISLFGPTEDLAPFNVQVQDLGPIGQTGFRQDEFTVNLPMAWFTKGVPQLEVAIYLTDVITGEYFYWGRSFPTVDAQKQQANFKISTTIHANLPSYQSSGITTFFGGLIAAGPTMITIHGKNGTQRFRSQLIQQDGKGGHQGSGTAVKWRLVAAPPMPTADSELLPWN